MTSSNQKTFAVRFNASSELCTAEHSEPTTLCFHKWILETEILSTLASFEQANTNNAKKVAKGKLSPENNDQQHFRSSEVAQQMLGHVGQALESCETLEKMRLNSKLSVHCFVQVLLISSAGTTKQQVSNTLIQSCCLCFQRLIKATSMQNSKM